MIYFIEVYDYLLYNHRKGVDDCMANIPEGKKQIMITLPDEIIKKIDAEAEANFIKRSQQITRIIIDRYKEDSK